MLPALLFVLVTLPFEVTNLDLLLTDPFYDFAGKRWPYIESWWARGVLHTGGKYLIWSLGSLPAIALLSSWHIARFAPWRRTCLYLVSCLVIAPTIVAILKVLTHRHCPWGIARYGGEVPWTLLFEFAPAGISGGNPGRCLPAAHASSALGLLGLYFVGHALGHPRPWLWALPGLVLGGAFAVGQQVRGAHFFSHNLWSLAVCWSVALALYRVFGGRIVPRRDPAAATDAAR